MGITVQGAASGTSTAKLLAAGDDFVTGRVVFKAMDATQPWGRLRGFNQNSLIELDNVVITGGGSVGGGQRNAVLAMAGAGTLPDAVLKVINVSITNTAGPGIGSARRGNLRGRERQHLRQSDHQHHGADSFQD